jgi:Heterokaryon incompatibility protein (HET)
MADVYSVADTVNVWLGPSDHITQLAFRAIRDVYNYKNNLCPGGAECTCPGTAHTMARKDIQNDLTDATYADAITRFHSHREPDQAQDHLRRAMQSSQSLISELFRNSWFKRVWVLQEVINSKRAVLHCGTESIPWNELVVANDYYVHMHRVPHLEPLYRLPQIWSHLGKFQNPSMFPSIRDTGEERLEAAQGIGILDVVLEALELDSTDPRDKLFALLSFGKETKIISHLPELIKPNYNKSIYRVFADFTRWWIKEHKSMRILSMIHGNMGRTWPGLHCPFADPPVTLRPTWTLRTEGMHRWTMATLESQFNFRASGDSVPDYEAISDGFNSNPLHLHLLGYKGTFGPLSFGRTSNLSERSEGPTYVKSGYQLVFKLFL